jgi:spore coat polysaccharide biosynthesis protein SpsF
MIRAAIILQARMGSARLPGKVMAPIAGRPLIAHCIARLTRSGLPVVVATTERREDDVLVDVAHDLGVPIVRGADQDVLARFVGAASRLALTHVVRATADNPVVDLDAPRRTLDLLCRAGAGYVEELGLPTGAAVEACTVDALRHAAAATADPYDREHVTPYLRRGLAGASVQARAPIALRRADLRFTVDSAADLVTVRALFDHLGDGATLAPLPAFIEAADQRRGLALAGVRVL